MTPSPVSVDQLARQIVVAWEAWIEAQDWAGPELDHLGELMEDLRNEVGLDYQPFLSKHSTRGHASRGAEAR